MAYLNRKADFDVGATPAATLGQLRGGSGKRVTIYDVARLVGVSAITVSRALNGGSCSAKTREAVQKAARKLGYEPNPAAQALASRKRKRDVTGDRPDALLSVPGVWQSYADMMFRLVSPQT